MRKLIKAALKKAGYTIIKDKQQAYDPEMFACLNNLKKLDVEVKSIIDVGAAAGEWSLLAEKVFPNANFLLLEPLEERKRQLELLVEQHPNFRFLPFAAGEAQGSVEFNITDDLDGSGIAEGVSNIKKTRLVNVTSIDHEIARQGVQGPYLVKLDTHGYEIPILNGCLNNFKNVSAFIIECYGFQIAKNSLLFWEMCEFMQKKGFRLYEIVDAYNRSKDNAFWQCDACFISDQHPVFRSNTYY